MTSRTSGLTVSSNFPPVTIRALSIPWRTLRNQPRPVRNMLLYIGMGPASDETLCRPLKANDGSEIHEPQACAAERWPRWRREPTRRRVVSWRVGPSSSDPKTRAPFELWRCAAVLPTSRHRSDQRAPSGQCLGPRVTSRADGRAGPSAARGFSCTRGGLTSRPCASRDASCQRPRRRRRGARREGSRLARAVGVTRHRVGKTARSRGLRGRLPRGHPGPEALPEAGLVDRSDVASR